jgi:single-stranded DNA-binding protein
MFKLTGTVKVLNNTVQVSEKFSKREFVVTDTTSMYPQDIMFQATQDKCSMLDAVQQGDQVEVSFNLRGREWTSPQGEVKYFNTLEAWRIEKVGAAAPQGMPQGGPSAMNLDPMTAAPSAAVNVESEDDDLPF